MFEKKDLQDASLFRFNTLQINYILNAYEATTPLG